MKTFLRSTLLLLAGLFVATTAWADAPAITAQTASSTFCAGGSIDLEVTATGTAPLSYQWYLNETTPIAGATSATLTLNNLTAASAGAYTVVVSNGEGSATNLPITLALNAPTTATALVGLANLCPGSAASFSTVASGTGPFMYQWTKDGAPIDGATDTSFSIASVTAADAGKYAVIVWGNCNSVTNSATLTVVATPGISSQPQSTAAPAGNTATFSVTGTSVSLSYQWQLNGENISGATSSSYTTPTLALGQSGNAYRVIISNCAGSITSSVATLTVRPVFGISFDFDTPGQFTNVPYNLANNNWLNSALNTPPMVFETPVGGVGPFPGSGCLDLIPNNGTVNSSILMPVLYDFSLPGKTLYASTMVKLKPPANNNRSTQIGFCTSTNADLDNSVGRSYMTVILQSTAQPALKYEVRQGSKPDAASSFFEGNAAAATLTAGNWYKLNAAFVNNAATKANTYTVSATLQDMGIDGLGTGSTVATLTTVTITNANVVASKSLCFVLRGIENTGVDLRDNTYVYATAGPVFFVLPPASQTVVQGGTASFQANVDGEGPYAYQWNKNGTPIPGARAWNYTTPPALPGDNGAQYTVTVTGPNNTLTSDPATLTVTPAALAVVSVGSVDGTMVGLRFNQPVNAASAGNPANYKINGIAPVQAILRGDQQSVLLSPAAKLADGFTVAVQNVTDLAGGALGSANSASGTVANLTGFDVNPAIIAPLGSQYSFAPNQFEITGAGVDIWNLADSFHFVYTMITGDFDLKAKIPYLDVVRGASKAGFMARPSLEPTSLQVHTAVNPMWPARNYPEGGQRLAYNIAATSWGATPQLSYPNVWLRFRRTGNTFMRYTSTDGVTWRHDGQTSVVLPDTLYVGLEVCSVANNNICTAQFENYGNFAGYPGAAIAITAQPTNSTINAASAQTLGLTATLSGGGAPAGGEISYVWQRSDGAGGWNNLATAGATNNTVSTGTLYITDNGAQYRCILKAPSAADVISAVATITVTDTAAPTISSVSNPVMAPNQVVVNFSEAVSAATATVAGNYTVLNGEGTSMGVVGAVLLDPRTVVLTTTSPLVVGSYSVVVNNVQDLKGNTIAANASKSVSVLTTPPTLPVVIEVYQDIGASADVNNLMTNGMLTTALAPTWITYSNLFGYNVAINDMQNQYGVRAYTYFVAPSNGVYKFWIRNDDGLAFYMNTDGTDPAGKTLLYNGGTTVSGNYAVRAQNLNLTGGQAYYMEVLLRENSGNDGFSVAVRAQADSATPANTEFIPTSMLAYPAEAARPTPVVVEIYTGLGGATLTDLDNARNSAKFQGHFPDAVVYEPYFGVQPSLINTRFDNYIARIYSYLVPPADGLYRLWIRMDDVGILYMNTNAVNSTDPAGKVEMCGRGQTGSNAQYQTGASVQNVWLNGGQKYYIEVLYKEGTGGDGLTLAVMNQNDPNPSVTGPVSGAYSASFDVTANVAPGSLFEFPLEVAPMGSISLKGIAPANTTANEGQTVTFTPVGINGTLLGMGYAWYKNGQLVLANSSSYTTLPLIPADNGAVITLVVTNGFSRAERSTTLNVLTDTAAPTLVSAMGWRLNDGVTLTFSEPLDASSATFLGNYQISGLTILSAARDATGTKVALATTKQTYDTVYTVTVNNVTDRAATPNVIAPNTTASFGGWGIGGSGFLVELFTNLTTGGAIVDLAGAPKFINNMPDVVGYVSTFYYASLVSTLGGFGPFTGNGLEYYGARVSGWFVPPTTSFYRFYLASDDASQLWMNVNATGSEDPAGKAMLIHVPSSGLNYAHPVAASPVLALNAGQRYYIEALLKEGTGGDYVRVAFRETDGNGVPLSGMPLDTEFAPASAFDGVLGNPDWAQVVSAPPRTITAEQNERINLMLYVNMAPIVASKASYKWQRADYGGDFINIPNATNANYSFWMSPDDDSASYRVVFSAPGRDAQYVTTMNLLGYDQTPPYLVTVSSLDGTSIGVRFNEPIDAAGAIDASLYTVTDAGGQPAPLIGPGVLQPDGLSVWFPVDLSNGSPIQGAFTVAVAGIVDSAGNQGSSKTNGIVQQLTAMDILGATALAGSTFSAKAGDFSVVASGADIWGTVDSMQFVYRPVLGNFDIKVRLESLDMPDVWAKAGLMARLTTNANSRNVCILDTPREGQNRSTFQWRPADGVISVSFHVPTPPMYPNAWLRLQRIGSVFYGYYGMNGSNWTLYSQSDTATTSSGPMPDQLMVGLAATAHNAALLAHAEFRDLHFPLPPAITVQPAGVTATVRSTATLAVTGSTPPNTGALTYQWQKEGLNIPGATSATLVLDNIGTDDEGNYTVLVGNDGGAVCSDIAAVAVNNAPPVVGADALTTLVNSPLMVPVADLLGNDRDPEGAALLLEAVCGAVPMIFSTDFNDALPAGTAIYGNAALDTLDGANGSGCLKLTPPAGSQDGSLVIEQLNPGVPVSAFTASFKLRIDKASAEPADGFSFNFSDALPDGTSAGTAEEGVGGVLSFCVDNYRFTGLANTAGMKLKYHNVTMASVQTPVWNSSPYIPVSITMHSDGLVTVLVNGTNIFGDVTIPYVPIAGRYGLFARTGGAYETHWVDDLSITVLSAGTVAGGTVALANGMVTYTPPQAWTGSDVFYYVASDGQLDGLVVGVVTVNVTDVVAPTMAAPAFNPDTGICSLSIPTSSGHIYRVMATDNLNPPVIWTEAAIFTGDGSVKIVNLPLSGNAQRFFRLKID
jgi:hypothetical protein